MNLECISSGVPFPSSGAHMLLSMHLTRCLALHSMGNNEASFPSCEAERGREALCVQTVVLVTVLVATAKCLTKQLKKGYSWLTVCGFSLSQYGVMVAGTQSGRAQGLYSQEVNAGAQLTFSLFRLEL